MYTQASRARRARRIGAIVLKPVAGALVTLFVITLLTFVATSGFRDPADIALDALGRGTSQERIDAYIQENALDQPLPVRYIGWVGDVVRGDLGESAVSREPVADAIGPRLVRSFVLAGIALALTFCASLVAGIAAARHPGSLRDGLLVTGAMIVAAFPEFIVGLAIIWLFALQFGLFPTSSGPAFAFGAAGDQLMAYIMPAMTIAVVLTAYNLRFVRSAIREALDTPHVETATLQGLAGRAVFWRYAFRSAAVPLLNIAVINVYFAIGSIAVVESVFSFPGLGQLLISAVGSSDTAVVLALVLIFGVSYVLANLLTDFLMLALNPRLRRRNS